MTHAEVSIAMTGLTADRTRPWIMGLGLVTQLLLDDSGELFCRDVVCYRMWVFIRSDWRACHAMVWGWLLSFMLNVVTVTSDVDDAFIRIKLT